MCPHLINHLLKQATEGGRNGTGEDPEAKTYMKILPAVSTPYLQGAIF